MSRADNGVVELTQLQRDLESARARLDGLLEAIAIAEERLRAIPAAVLVEVNAELVEAALHAQQQASTDALTGLANRTLFNDRLEHAMSVARRDGSRLALMFVDIDGLKRINDEQGHSAGDQLLQHAAKALLTSVRESDTVCRHGGDEFLVLLPAVTSDADLEVLARKLQAALAVPCQLGQRMHSTSASIGVSVYPGSGSTAAELIAHADLAMYRAKRREPGSVEFDRPPAATGAQRIAAAPHAATTAAPNLSPRRAEEARELMRDTSERLVLGSLQQTDFMAMVSHEFRNPLASISSAAALLQHPRADAAMMGRIGPLLARQVVHLTRLSDDLMIATKAGSDGFQLELQRTDLLPLVGAAIEACQDGITKKGQQLEQDLGPGPWIVSGDPVRLAQVLRNLLDNACKYTPDGGSISIGLRDRGSLVEVAIADSGIGLSPASLDAVFGLFSQDSRGAAQSGGGLGIGLAVVRRLVEDHGGHIEAHSAGADQGSVFVFTLRRAL